MHQIFALVDVKYEHVFPTVSGGLREKNILTHFREVAEELAAHNGLNYVPRERTTDGRVFEHAADCKVLIDHLAQLPANVRPSQNYKAPSKDDVCFFVQIVEEGPGGKDDVDEHAKMREKYE